MRPSAAEMEIIAKEMALVKNARKARRLARWSQKLIQKRGELSPQAVAVLTEACLEAANAARGVVDLISQTSANKH